MYFKGSVKDSVVGEERIAQYLLAVLNSRRTPLHWNHLNNRRLEGIQYATEGKREYSLKDLRPKRRKPPNNSDVLYIEVIDMIPLTFYLSHIGWPKFFYTVILSMQLMMLGIHFKLH